MGMRKHSKVVGNDARQGQPAVARQEAQQAPMPQLAPPTIEMGIGGSPNIDAHTVQLSRLAPAQRGRAGRQLQRAYGNHYVAQVAAHARASAPLVVQPKLMVTPPGDRYEQEADRVADHVAQQISTSQVAAQGPSLQRQPDDSGQEAVRMQRAPGMVQLQAAGAVGGIAGDTGVESAIQAARGGGHALPEDTRAAMEVAFGADFGGVRVHTDVQSDALNESLSARALTTGQDIFFRQGQFDPGSAEGQRLLAHELTHVVQQEGTQPTTPTTVQRKLVMTSSDMAGKPGKGVSTYAEILESLDSYHKSVD